MTVLQQLLPNADPRQTVRESVFLLDQPNVAWRPGIGFLQARSFPTPYAQAEMMAYVLGALPPDKDPEKIEADYPPNPRLSQSYAQWRLLLLGIVSGQLRLETIDLERPEAGRFGAMLRVVRDEVRFITLIRDPAANDRIVGALDPRCLVWAAPRARAHLLALRPSIEAKKTEALQLLAEWKSVLAEWVGWPVTGPEVPAWIRGLDLLLTFPSQVNPSPGKDLLRAHCRHDGPVRLRLAVKAGAPPNALREVLVYLPVLHRDWLRQHAALISYSPSSDAEGRRVTLADPMRVPSAYVELSAPASVGARNLPEGGDRLLAGLGKLTVERNPSAAGFGAASQLGAYEKLVLPAIVPAVQQSSGIELPLTDGGNATGEARREAQRVPIVLPDALRIVLLQGGVVGEGQEPVYVSKHVLKRLGNRPPPVAAADLRVWSGRGLPAAISVPGSERDGQSASLVETVGTDEEGSRKEDIGEVRALGLGLWLFFTREAQTNEQRDSVVWQAMDGTPRLFRVYVEPNGGRENPLWVSNEALDAVNATLNPTLRAKTKARVASLQRFLASYRKEAPWVLGREGVGSVDQAQAAFRLARIAAETFVCWALEIPYDRLDAYSFGKTGTRAGTYDLGRGCVLPLLLDELR